MENNEQYLQNGDAQAGHATQAISPKGQGVVQGQYEAKEFEAPHFVSQLACDVAVDEGEAIRLSAQILPANDHSLRVEWMKNGKPLASGSRFSTICDRGYVALDILYSIEEDTGSYSCVVKSNSGHVEANAAAVTVVPEAKVDNNADFIQSQHTTSDQSEPPTADKHQSLHAPEFHKDLTASVNVNQGDPVHLETFVEPRNDVTLTVEWHKNGKSLALGSRFNAIFDRGYCALDIAYTYAHDDGTYVCVAHNSLGENQSNAATITCHPDESIVTKSNLNEESISRLKQFEYSGVDDRDHEEFQHNEDVEADLVPTFEKGLQDVTIDEGCPSKFFINIHSHPRARLVWSIDNEEVISDSVNKFYSDGTINYLELNRCTDVGQHHIRVVATNPIGQTSSECVLTVNSVNNFAKDLKHIAPENPYKRIAALKKVEVTPELTTALHKPKPTAEKIVKIERTTEVNSRHFKSTETTETEKMYDDVAAKLKSKGNISTGKRSVSRDQIKMQPVQPQALNNSGNFNEMNNDFSMEQHGDMPPPPSA